MPLLPYAPDPAIDRLILDWSTQWRSIVGFDLNERGGPGRNGIKVLRFPIWIQHFYDIGTADMRTHAMRAGWRFLVTHGRQHLAVDFRHDGKTLDRFTFHSLNTGQHIDGLRAKIDGLKVAWNYRLAQLDVPGLGESALWLLPTKLNAHPQLFFPTGTVSSSFDWDKLYTAEEYQRKLAELAAAHGNNRIVHPADLAPAINPAATYKLTCEAHPGYALDGVHAFERPKLRKDDGGNLQKWRLVPAGGGYFRIHCLGIGPDAALEGGSPDEGALMNGTANQSGQLWRHINVGNGHVHLVNMFMEVNNYALDGGEPGDKALISLSGNLRQNWKLTEVASAGGPIIYPPPSMASLIDVTVNYRLTNRASGDGVALDGVGAFQQPAMIAQHGGSTQVWQFAEAGGGFFRLHCMGLGYGLALEGGAKDQGALMNGTSPQSGQVWKPIDLGNGYFKLVNQFTEADNYALDGGLLRKGALISPRDKPSQDWKLTMVH